MHTDSLTDTRAALNRAAHRTADLMRGGLDPRLPVPGLTWTVGEVAAHLVLDLRQHTDRLTGGGTVVRDGADATVRGAEANRRELAGFAERRPTVLADALEAAVAAYLDIVATAPGVPIETANAVPVTPSTLTAILLGEQVVHGLDLARATGRPWTVDREDALRVVPALMELAPAYLDRRRASGLRVVYELRFGPDLPRYHFAVAGGVATTEAIDEATAGHPDCVITADPVAFLLLGYGRSGRLAPVLRGKLRAGGRKPWLAGRFATLLTSP